MTPENQLAALSWDFMGGWHPELLPMIVKLYDVEDVQGLINRLLIIRDLQNESRHSV